MKAARKLISATVERSRRVYGVIYGALPEELRLQVADLPAGWAYGLWKWLQDKFQSTEEDSVNTLLREWMELKQEDESFDSYKAKVNKLYTLLDHAKEKPSARLYAFTMLDKLLPRYATAVLALKASGQLKDASAISWDAVSAFINAHERNEQRLGSDEDKTMMARAGGIGAGSAPRKDNSQGGTSSGSSGGQARIRTLADVQCFNCQAFGHMKRTCPQAKKKQHKQRADASTPYRFQGCNWCSGWWYTLCAGVHYQFVSSFG